MKTIATFLVPLLAALLNGCASATSPLAEKPSSPITATQIGVLGGGTLLGAAAGDAIGGTKGAVIGGAVGLAGSALAYNAVADHNAELVAEAEARGERKGRVEVFEQMWDMTARSPNQASQPPQPSVATTVSYPAQTIEGIKFAPRQDDGQPLQEPAR